MRCSMYVSGVVSGSMLMFMGRGPSSIAVPAPVFQETDVAGPT